MPEPALERNDSNQIGEVVDLVKTYIRQETVGPLKGIGRWVGLGVAGSMVFGLGLVFMVLGILRLLQTEAAGTFHGNWSVLPYVIALATCALVVGFAISRIRKDTLQPKEPRR